MRLWLVCGLMAATVGAGTGFVIAADSPPPAEASTPEAVVEALYRAVSFEPGGGPDWQRLRSLMLPGAVLAQPVRGGDGVELLTGDGRVTLAEVVMFEQLLLIGALLLLYGFVVATA